MPYRLRPHPGLFREIAQSWGLSDFVFTERHIRLEALRDDPKARLERVTEPLDGMAYRFFFSDPEVPGRDHLFSFSVRYLADEETILLLAAEHITRDRAGGRARHGPRRDGG